MPGTGDGELTGHASGLAERGDLIVAVSSLMDADLLDPAVDLLDEHAVRPVSLGEHDEVRRAAELLPATRRSPAVMVAHLDSKRHALGVTMSRIEQLIQRMEGAGRPGR